MENQYLRPMGKRGEPAGQAKAQAKKRSPGEAEHKLRFGSDEYALVAYLRLNPAKAKEHGIRLNQGTKTTAG